MQRRRALGGERARALGAVRGALRAGRLLGRLVAVRPPHGVDRGAARGGQPVPDRSTRRRGGCTRSSRCSALVALDVLAAGVHDATRDGACGAAPAIGFAVAFAAMLYTHNWALFFGAATGVAWLVAAVARGAGRARGGCCAPALVAYGGALLLYLPWIPTTLYQAAHTGAPWSQGADARDARLGARRGCSARSPRSRVAARRRRRASSRCCGPRRRAAAAARPSRCSLIARADDRRSPGSPRSSRRRGRTATSRSACRAFAAARARPGSRTPAGSGSRRSRSSPSLWAVDGAPDEKSNVRDVAEAIAPDAAPGRPRRLHPARAGLRARLLPARRRCATRRSPGRCADAGVTDWRDGVERLERDVGRSATSRRCSTRCSPASGSRSSCRRSTSLGRWSAPWTSLVRLRSEEWLQYALQRPALRRSSTVEPARPVPGAARNPVRAQVYLKR